MPQLRALLLAFVPLLTGCPHFQQTPVHFWGDKGFVEVDGKRIFVEDRGQGPAMLLIHGYGSAHDAWAAVIKPLSRHYRVLAVDLPGFGRSDKYPGDYSPQALARTLLAVLAQKGVQRAHVLAHSWGCSIALSLALAAPEKVQSLALFGAWVFEEQLPPFMIWARAPGVGEALYAMFYRERLDDRMALAFYNPEPFTSPDVIDTVRRALGRPGAVAAALAAARGQRFAALQRRYHTITQPTLLVWGAQDRVSRPRFGHRLAETLPQSELVIVPRCGHMPMLERPRQSLRALNRFYAELANAPASRPAAAEARSAVQP